MNTTLPLIDSGVGARILERRRDLDLSGRQLAELAGISHSHVSLIEAGKRRPTWELLDQLAAALQDNAFRLADGTARSLR